MELTTQVVVSWLTVQLLQLLKKLSGVPWIHESSDRVNRTVGAVLAALAAIGISFHYDAAAGTLLISGLTLEALVNFVWTWVSQFAFQQIVYHGAVKNGATKPPVVPV